MASAVDVAVADDGSRAVSMGDFGSLHTVVVLWTGWMFGQKLKLKLKLKLSGV